MKNPAVHSAAVICLCLSAATVPGRAQVKPITDAAFRDSLNAAEKQALAKPEKGLALAGGPVGGGAPKAAPAEENPCKENTGLETRRYRFTLVHTSSAVASPLVVNFTFSGPCSVTDRNWDGDPVTPSAGRSYTGDAAGYSLQIGTELGDASSGLSITQSENGGRTFLFAANFNNSVSNQDLLNAGTVRLGEVRMMDWRQPRGLELRGTATLEVTAIR